MLKDEDIATGGQAGALTEGKRLRLLIVSHHFPSHAKPTHAIYNKQQFHALSARFDIKVLVPVDWVSWTRQGKRALSGDSPLDVHYVPYLYIPKVLRRLSPALMRLSIGPMFRRLMRWQPDAVLASWAFPDVVAVRGLLGTSTLPLFAAVHGSDVHVHCLVPSRKHQVVDAFNTAAAVFTVSAELRERLIEHGVDPHRLIVSYNGVDDSKFFPLEQSATRQSLGLPADQEIFLFVGNIKEPKGPFDLLAAFRKLAERGRLDNAMLVYIGKGEEQRRLTQLGEALGKEFPGVQVLVRGAVPHEQINAWMNAADYVCLPSHSEGVPNVVLEAMRCGIPVVASSVGGIPEVLDARCGVLVPAKDIGAIADGLDKARTMDWDADAIRSYSQRFQWGKNADHIHRLIRELCEQ